jgi:hypothetical protein
MNMVEQSHRRTREVVQLCLFLGVFVLEVSSSWAKRPILFGAGIEPQSKQESTGSSKPQARPESKENGRFQLRLVSDGILCPIDDLDCEGRDIRWKNFVLLASDGHTLNVTSIPFPTVERSKKHFEATIKGAEKILRNEPESDSKGKPVGERALGSFPAIKAESKPPSGVTHYMLFWRWGKNCWELTGEHLEDVLALESRLNEEGTRAIWSWH